MLRRKQLILLIIVLLASCARNEAWREVVETKDCSEAPSLCIESNHVIEKYDDFNIGYIEFTERGNIYNQKAVSEIYKKITELKKPDDHVAVVVYVHGWKHNANGKDKDVIKFKELLSKFKSTNTFGKKNIFGVYIGWRGLSLVIPGLRELTFWDRKSVAEEVGTGGVTRILTALHALLISEKESMSVPFKATNNYMIIGHSFGGAVVLQALHDVLVSQLVEAQDQITNGVTSCKRVQRFADAIILFNPAIEANKIIQLKELAANCHFIDYQPRILHVISSDGDWATRLAFPMGQWLGLGLTWNQKSNIRRNLNNRTLELDEHDLDYQTVGNLIQFRTGRLEKGTTGEWEYYRCRNSLTDCGITKPDDVKNHIPHSQDNPIHFIKTDSSFITGHNDILKNCKAQSYLATLILEQFAVGQNNETTISSETKGEDSCKPKSFYTPACYDHQFKQFECKN